MCLYPRIIKNPKYTKTKKNGGVIPPINDTRVLGVPIGCQNCMECRKQKAREWQVRMTEDIKEHKNGKFTTLTFSNEEYTKIKNTINIEYPEIKGYALDNEIATYAIRHFLERHRKKYKKPLRHWLITELGHKGTENIHLHGIIWTNETMKEIENIWKYGFIWKGEIKNGKLVNYVSSRTINYMIKYIHKVDLIHKTYKSKILTSAGIGRNYTTNNPQWKKNTYKNGSTNETYRTEGGYKIALPIYWRNKIYNEEEREKLWLQKLDKEERWVGGEKVNISQGEEAYYKLLEWYRTINERLGYGTNKNNWKRQKYEEERRIIIQSLRGGNSKDIGLKRRDEPRTTPAEGAGGTDKINLENKETNAILAHYLKTKT